MTVPYSRDRHTHRLGSLESWKGPHFWGKGPQSFFFEKFMLHIYQNGSYNGCLTVDTWDQSLFFFPQ